MNIDIRANEPHTTPGMMMAVRIRLSCRVPASRIYHIRVELTGDTEFMIPTSLSTTMCGLSFGSLGINDKQSQLGSVQLRPTSLSQDQDQNRF